MVTNSTSDQRSEIKCVVCIQDVSKKKWILTGTVGSGGFGLIYFAEEQVSPSHFYKITSSHSLLVNKII